MFFRRRFKPVGAARTVPEKPVLVDGGIGRAAPDVSASAGHKGPRRDRKPVHLPALRTWRMDRAVLSRSRGIRARGVGV